ncbi:spore coat protein U domain-containing protein [Acinetobacter baumannii]|uniref:Csu type fimbrial protein n=1 Tax=Acinetobacter calcoaceticus/baumannii complex TaxID=909768 RepID=UPI0008387A9D|nr:MULTISPECIES: spore coat protein U domain-containing protein [Acinetobacter calcoaceticus/baumannii complex]MDH2526514.1 spore coat protein U domain-containing protein [Acinetobacter baumannii]MDV7432865.1 spore coat protein U domain-containing protein [Acinetobacter baumannii]OCY54715.1 protein CsuE [Acinetobacter pittii]HCW3749056.1 spore coat protein U domain-containing protein [Acinetobacter baumannii]
MNIRIKKLISNLALSCGLMAIGNVAYAACSVNDSGSSSISVPSIYLMENGENSSQFNSGLSCTGFSLALANMTYLKYRVEQMSNTFTNAQTGEKLNAIILDSNNEIISLGQEKDMSSFTLVNLFSGPDGNLPFYIRLPAGQSVSPGVYRADTPLKVKWFYSVPAVAVAGIGFYFESPGFKRGVLGIGFNWGSGADSLGSLSITVLPDCRILTQDVNFGTAAFASKLEPVQSSMGIRCSLKTPYYVSLNNGLSPQNGDQRAMKSQSGNVFLKYDIFKNSSNDRWGSGNERWSSLNATINPGVHDAVTQQNYVFTTKITDENADTTPAGVYQDTVTVQVEF